MEAIQDGEKGQRKAPGIVHLNQGFERQKSRLILSLTQNYLNISVQICGF